MKGLRLFFATLSMICAVATSQLILVIEQTFTSLKTMKIIDCNNMFKLYISINLTSIMTIVLHVLYV